MSAEDNALKEHNMTAQSNALGCHIAPRWGLERFAEFES
jgi:hypothetical protein